MADIDRLRNAYIDAEALKGSNIDVTTDAKQDPTEKPSVRQDETKISIDFGKDGVTHIYPLQGEWTPVYRFDKNGQIRDTMRVRVEGGAPERQYTEDEIRRAYDNFDHYPTSVELIGELRRDR